MNYNTYPTTANVPEKMNDAEKAYREVLCKDVVEASTGTVGVYTSLDLNAKDGMLLSQTIRDRNPGDDSVNIRGDNGGWGDYGERSLLNEENILLRPKTYPREGINEEISFVEQPDGTTKIGYVFNSDGYKDGTGRPNNTLNVGFTLPGDKASELQHALQSDPNYMKQVLKAQIIGLGFTEERYQMYMEPRFGFRNEVLNKDRVLVINTVAVDGNLEADALTYGEGGAILNEAEPAVEAFEVSGEQADPMARWDEYFDGTLKTLHDYVEDQRASGANEQDIIKQLGEWSDTLLQQVHEDDSSPEDDRTVYNAAISSAYMSFITKMEEHNQQQAADSEVARERADVVAVAHSEVMDSFASPEDVPFKQGDQVIVAGQSMQVVESYLAGNGTTTWFVVQDQSGVQKHVKASSVSRAN